MSIPEIETDYIMNSFYFFLGNKDEDHKVSVTLYSARESVGRLWRLYVKKMVITVGSELYLRGQNTNIDDVLTKDLDKLGLSVNITAEWIPEGNHVLWQLAGKGEELKVNRVIQTWLRGIGMGELEILATIYSVGLRLPNLM